MLRLEETLMRLQDKVAFISGAASGIGHAAAVLFAQEGAAVMLADRDAKLGVRAADEIAEFGGEAAYVQCDVTNAASVDAAITQTMAHYGKLNVLYNNAGGSYPGSKTVTEATDEDFWAEINLNLYGTWLGCRYGIRALIQSGGGSVINTSSAVAISGNLSDNHAYVAAKGAISALTRGLASRYGRDKVRVNAIVPGVTKTERVLERVKAPLPTALVDRHLLGFGEPGCVAATALFLASDESTSITGQNLAVDSGYTIS
jgi:NAD(P)-dependent dehydrogenase (short-subunit alcohol dehydrogenase family)